MGRYDWMESCDEDWLAYGRWLGRVKTVLNGKPGREALQELEAVLLAMPHKRLIEGTLCETGGEFALGENQGRLVRFPAKGVGGRDCGVCAVGAWMYRRWVDGGMSPRDAWKKLKTVGREEDWRPHWTDDSYDEYERTTTAAVAELGITETLAMLVSYENDEEFWRRTPEERYEYVLGWIRRALAGQVSYYN